MSVELDDEFPSKYEIDEDDANTANPILNDVRHSYGDALWSQEFFRYDPKPREFIGAWGPKRYFALFSTILQLFHLFWPQILL